MHIRSILAAAAFGGCILAATGFAAVSGNKDDEAAAADPEARSAGAPMPAEPAAQRAQPDSPVAVRNTRPKNDRHKDARACLEAGSNGAIIKCANKYR